MNSDYDNGFRQGLIDSASCDTNKLFELADSPFGDPTGKYSVDFLYGYRDGFKDGKGAVRL